MIIASTLMDLTQHTGRGGRRAGWTLVPGSVLTVPRSAGWSLAFESAVGQPDHQLRLRSSCTGGSAKDLWEPLSCVPSGTGKAYSPRPGN